MALHTGLFPDAGTVEAALAGVPGAHEILRADLTGPDLRDQGWDRIIQEILAADLVVTI